MRRKTRKRIQQTAASTIVLLVVGLTVYEIAVVSFGGQKHTDVMVVHEAVAITSAVLLGMWLFRATRLESFMKMVDKYYGQYFMQAAQERSRNMDPCVDRTHVVNDTFLELWVEWTERRQQAFQKAALRAG